MGNEDAFVIKKSAVVYSVLMLAVFALGVFAESQLSITGAFFGPKGDTTTTTTTLPQRADVSIDDDPMLGDKNAPVTVIEFSDFQCPYCRIAYVSVLPQLKEEYVKTGKINFVYRDFPLPPNMHPAAQRAAEAAECADEQGKFWEMHDKIFDEQSKEGTGTVAFNITDLKNWAAEIGLDTSKFNGCLDSEKYKSEVQKDQADGESAGVQGTPTFFIGNPKDGYVVLGGAYPYSVFKQVIDQELQKLGK